MPWRPNFSEIALLVYLAFIAIEVALVRAGKIKGVYEPKDTAASLAMVVGNGVTTLLMAGLVLAALTAAHAHRLFNLSPRSLLTWIALFFLDDLTYYWFHRISHECRLWWAAHVNHHSSRRYNLSTALRQTWTGELAGTWALWIPLALIGFPPGMILLQQSLSLAYQFWIHTEAIDRMPRWFEYLFNTPSHHRVHHASNPRYLDRNYAGVLMVWDRVFGTFAAETSSEPPNYGLVKNIDTFNPLKVAFHEWAAMGRDLVRARSMAEAAGVVFGAPGWRPGNMGTTSRQIREAWRRGEGLAR
jgi:sterol desaturase/sphingolipid hydroxylase (fatty acid hydroxylase superfamily)